MARICQNLQLKFLVLILALHLIVMAAEARSKRYLRASTRLADDNSFNVEKYGAVGDEGQDNTEAFMKAWNDACKASSATLLVPGGKTFLVNNLNLQGPCQPGFTFQIDGTIVAPEDPERWNNKQALLVIQHLETFTLTGKGTIDGKGSTWWGKYDARPMVLLFNDMKAFTFSGLTLVNGPFTHVEVVNSDGVEIVGITIQAPENSPNTDGIDILQVKNLQIKNSIIGTGDDCVGVADLCSDITVSGVTCGPGHGISIGSLGRGNSRADVRSVHVSDCKFKSTTNGLRIKTWPGGSGSATNITYENIEMDNVQNPIIIDQHYCGSGQPGSCESDKGSAVKISNVKYSNITGISATNEGAKFSCTQSGSCEGITVEDVQLKVANSGGEATCAAQNAEVQSVGSGSYLTCKDGLRN